MVKLMIAVAFAMIACILTALSAITGQARTVTILYRMGVSMLLFGLVGYVATWFLQTKIKQKLLELQKDQQKVDISPSNNSIDESTSQGNSEQFNPLQTEKLEHITEVKH